MTNDPFGVTPQQSGSDLSRNVVPKGMARSMERIEVVGRDAVSFLNGQVTADVTEIAPGDMRDTLLLDPSGKVISAGAIYGTDEHWAMVVEPGFGSVTLERLQRFAIRVKATFSLDDVVVDLGFTSVTDEPTTTTNSSELRGSPLMVAQSVGVTARQDYSDLGAVDRPEELAALDAFRITRSIVRLGKEITTDLVPASLGGAMDAMVSFSKGCYTGQELVARMDARGSTAPLVLHRFSFEQGATVHAVEKVADIRPEEPIEISGAEGEVAGSVTSLARLGDGEVIGLGFLRRAAVEREGLEVVLEGYHYRMTQRQRL